MKRLIRRAASLLALLLVAGFALFAEAGIIYESGTLGSTGLTFTDFSGTGAPESSGVTPTVFSGVRFELTEPVITTRVGGHFVIQPGADDSFFGAIVQLDSMTDFPDSGDLATPDFLGESLLTFPDTSTEVFGDLTLSLDPGWYALVFGSGLFKATGSGAAVLNNPDIGSPLYIGHQPAASWIELSTLPGPFGDYRLVVEGVVVPEPTAIALVLLGITLQLRSLRFFRKRCVLR